jgi:peptidyl-tRNA hydrolase
LDKPILKMYAIFARETLRQMQFEGKLAAQAGHCYLHAWWDAEDRLKFKPPSDFLHSEYTRYWTDVCVPYRQGNDARKITLVVDTVEELESLYEEFRIHMGATFVEDCGYTVFKEPTITGVGLGPIPSGWVAGTRLGDLDTLRNEIHAD